ncbi:MAG: hypothetical protein NTV50_04540 [Planctomycetota bacterium]|nr:hypothetical protein [Planctomycetota bacterium]
MQAGRITRCMTCAMFILAYLVMVLPSSSQDNNSLDRIISPQFRIVVVPPGKNAKFLEKNVREAFVPIPASEFEKLRKTATPNSQLSFIPALTQASYQGEWKDNGIVGKANWVFNSSSKNQTYFPIAPLNIAIKKASWKDKEALLGDFIPGTTSLLIPENNESACDLEWSLKTEQLPDGHHVLLRIPQASLQSFELAIPFNWNFILISKGSVETYSPVPNSIKKVLKIIASGETKIELLLQDPAMHGRFDGLRIEKLQASHEIVPEATYSEFVFSFEGLTNGSKILEFEYSESLKILEVLSDQVESWKILVKDNTQVLEVVLHNNLCRPDKIVIKTLGSSIVKKSSLWKTPWVRFNNLPSYREEITILAGAEIRFEDLIMGDFLLADTRSKQLQNSALRLVGGGLTSRKNLTYPSIRVSVGGAQFRTQQELLFQPTISGASLQSTISYFLLNGSISSLLVQLPAGWGVEQLSLNADTHIKDWSVLQNQGKQLLRIELENPLIPSNSKSLDQNKTRPPTLSIRMAPDTKSKKTNLWGFPSVLPLNSMLNEGFFAIQYEASSYQSKLKSDLIEIDGQSELQSFKQPYNHLFKFIENFPVGSIELIPLTGVSILRCNSTILMQTDKFDTKLDILLGSENGLVDKFDLLLPRGENPENWKWISPNRNITFKKIEKINAFEIANIVAGLNPLPGISLYNLSAIFPLSERWRFHLFQPLNSKEAINFNATFTTLLPKDQSEIPLICFPSDQRFEATLQIESPKSRTIDFRYKGLKSLPSTKPKFKNFVYDSSFPSLTIKSFPQTDSTPYGIIEQASLEKSFHANGRIQNELKITIKEWDNDFFDITLPVKSDVKEIRINNKIVSNFIFNENQLRIPYLTTSIINPSFTQLVISYQEDAPKGWLWKTIDCNYPELPVSPLDNNIIWVIPPGMEPITFSNTKRRLGNVGGEEKPEGALGYLFPLNYLLGSNPLIYENHNDANVLLNTILQQKPVLNSGDSGKFNELVKSLQLYLIKNNYSLVLDQGCTEIANLNSTSNLPDISKTIAENLNILGLELVPISNVVLLTSSKNGAVFVENKSAAFTISIILQEALNQGIDKSKRYVSAWKWLLDFPHSVKVSSSFSPMEISNGPKRIRWQLFQEKETLTLVDSHHIQVVGLLIGFFLMVFIANKNIPYMINIEPALALFTGLSLGWLPLPLLPLVWWFIFAWCIKKVGQYFIFIATPSIAISSKSITPSLVKTTYVFLGIIFFYNTLIAQTPVIFDVYLLVEPDSSAKEATYLVPEALIKQFKDSKLQSTDGKAFITKAQYEGSVLNNSIDFKVIWNVHCTGFSNLEIPVSGGWLTDKMFLNDLPAYPVTKANGSLILPIPKKGDYVLKAEFKVGVSEKLAERTATFRLPASPINFFQCALPENVEQPSLAGSLGASLVVRSGKSTRLNADLGKVLGPLNLKWSNGPLPPKSKPSIKEAYIWDISLDSSRMQAFWDLQIPEAGTDFFEIDLPPNLLPSTLNPIVRQGQTPVALINWNLKPTPIGQRFTLNFSRRISGNIQISAFFIPMNGMATRWQVPVPTPVGVFIEGGSFLAYKSLNCNTTRQVLPLRLTGISSKNFAPFWPETEKPEPESLAFAYSFRREPNNPPVLTLDISPLHFKFDATQLIKGHFQSKSSQFSINASLKSILPDILFVEWQVDGQAKYIVTKLVGDGIQSWAQNGTKVIIWLDKPAKEVSFVAEILATALESNSSPIIEVPRSNFLFATKTTTNIVLSHDTNINLKPINFKGFSDTSDPLALISNEKNYQAQFEIKPSLSSGVANILLWFDQKDGITRAKLDIEINRTNNDVPIYEFSIRGWEDEDLKFELPPDIKLEPLSKQENIRKWSLIIPESQKKGLINFSISCDVSKSLSNGTIQIPMWNLKGVESVNSWIGVSNEVLSMENMQGLAKVANGIVVAEIPMLRKKIGNSSSDFYKVNAKTWNLNVRLSNQKFNTEESPIVIHNIIHGEAQKNGSIKGSSVFWVYFPVPGSFKVLLPKPSEFISCHLDESLIYPENVGEDQMYVFKSSKVGFQKLKISFQLLKSDLLWADFLNKTPVYNSKVRFGKTVIVGTQPYQSWKVESSALYVQELAAMEYLAKSLLDISKNRAKEAGIRLQDLSNLQPIQDLFFQIIARAKVLDSLTENGMEFLNWTEELLLKNRESAIEFNYQAIVAKAELNADKKSFNDISNLTNSIFNPKIVELLASETVPDLTMILRRGPGFLNATWGSAIWVGLIISIYYFSSLSKFHKILAITWPEQFLLGGICLYLFLGLTIIVLICFILGVLGRIFVLLFFRKLFIQSLQLS